jgi:polyisoprenoid-binding protein YceI
MTRMILSTLLLCSLSFAQQPNSARQYPIDMNHSTVGFSVSIMGGLSKVSGKFTDFSITLTNDEHDVTKSSVNVVIKAASINTGITARDNHLRTADFFDVAQFPEITFQSKRIEKQGKGFIAVGDLTMHGVTREIILPFSIAGTNRDAAKKKMNIGYAAHLALNRRDFGINWEHQSVPNFVGDNVDIDIALITRAVDLNQQ